MRIALLFATFIIGYFFGAISSCTFFAGIDNLCHGINIETAAYIFTKNGLPATRKTSTAGEPYLGSNVRGDDFEVHFYDCKGDKKDEKCEDMALFAGYPVRNPPLEIFNGWNAKARVGKVYLNDMKDVAFLRVDIHAKDGIGNGEPDYYIKTWQLLMPAYADYLRRFRLR